jgi:uncharacterized membrane protein YraQ (UPF0718 family)
VRSGTAGTGLPTTDSSTSGPPPTGAPAAGPPPAAAPPTLWAREWKPLLVIVAGFLLCFYLPVELLRGLARLPGAFWEGLYLARWYAREHVILCLVPAFFIAGAIGVFVSQASVLKYLGAGANKVVAYGVASVSGTLLAVCSCTVLPLFAGIYGMGAGLGPASAFLYAGPAINVLAIIFTARVLGLELGVARAIGAIIFSVFIGLFMHFIFRKEEMEKARIQARTPMPEVKRPLWQNGLFFASLLGVLVFANFGEPARQAGLWYAIYSSKWLITGAVAIALAVILVRWFEMEPWKVAAVVVPTAVSALFVPGEPLVPFAIAVVGLSIITSTQAGEPGDWFGESWKFAKQILPLLLVGVLIAGMLLGRPGHEGFIPSSWVSSAVGGNSLVANFFAAIAGAFMYFATLTEVPILQGLIGNGMGAGPALALLLAGPALSLPNMLVIRSVMGTRKTLVYVALVVVMSTVAGLAYGAFHG